ncbi:hypothetical protein P3L10_028766 [Capsicum annuum]
MDFKFLFSVFSYLSLPIEKLVALSGAHAIGFSYCKEFSSNLYNYNRTSQFDPSYSPRLAQALRNTCVNQQKDPTYPCSTT